MHEDDGQVVVGGGHAAEVLRLVDLDVEVDRVVGDDHARRAVERTERHLLAGGTVADDAVLAGDADGAGGSGQAGCAHDGAEDAALDAQRVVLPESSVSARRPSVSVSVSTCLRTSRPPTRVTIS